MTGAVKLRPIDWTEPKLTHEGSDLMISYGAVKGLRIGFVMGCDDNWNIGPMFGAEGTPREIGLYAQNMRRTLEEAQADCHTLVSMYIKYLTEA